MNALTRNETHPVDAQPVYLDLPAARASWRLSQLHGAGVHPESVTFANGRMTVGPLSPAEYAAAWAALERQERPAERAAWWLPWSTVAWAALVVVGVMAGGFALPAIALLLVLGVPVAGAYVLSAWLTTRGALRRQRLGTRHPDAGRRRLARLLMPAPYGCLAAIVAVAVLALLGAIAMGGGL